MRLSAGARKFSKNNDKITIIGMVCSLLNRVTSRQIFYIPSQSQPKSATNLGFLFVLSISLPAISWEGKQKMNERIDAFVVTPADTKSLRFH